MNWNHIYFMMTDRDFIPPISVTNSICACSEETLKRFDSLPFQNKVCIVRNEEYTKRYQSCIAALFTFPFYRFWCDDHGTDR